MDQLEDLDDPGSRPRYDYTADEQFFEWSSGSDTTDTSQKDDSSESEQMEAVDTVQANIGSDGFNNGFADQTPENKEDTGSQYGQSPTVLNSSQYTALPLGHGFGNMDGFIESNPESSTGDTEDMMKDFKSAWETEMFENMGSSAFDKGFGYRYPPMNKGYTGSQHGPPRYNNGHQAANVPPPNLAYIAVPAPNTGHGGLQYGPSPPEYEYPAYYPTTQVNTLEYNRAEQNPPFAQGYPTQPPSNTGLIASQWGQPSYDYGYQALPPRQGYSTQPPSNTGLSQWGQPPSDHDYHALLPPQGYPTQPPSNTGLVVPQWGQPPSDHNYHALLSPQGYPTQPPPNTGLTGSQWAQPPYNYGHQAFPSPQGYPTQLPSNTGLIVSQWGQPAYDYGALPPFQGYPTQPQSNTGLIVSQWGQPRYDYGYQALPPRQGYGYLAAPNTGHSEYANSAPTLEFGNLYINTPRPQGSENSNQRNPFYRW